MSDYARSPHWVRGRFVNAIPTSIDISVRDMPALMRKMFARDPHRQPSRDLDVVSIDPSTLINTPRELTRVSWFGHSAILLEINGIKILIDPMFGRVPAPLPFLGKKRYHSKMPISIDDLPQIDLVVMSHDHYDHLDHGTILKLKHKVSRFVTSLGVGRHLRRWGVDADLITELDWGNEIRIDDLTIACTPARHFSGRGLWDRNRTFWSSWVFKTTEHRIFFSADSGYAGHFREIGEQHGPFDLAMMECGQYNPRWQAIHMMPEESVQAAIDVGARVAMPIHWAAFTLAFHSWTDPVERFTAEALRRGLAISTPQIGEPVVVGGSYPSERWWTAFQKP